MSTPARKQAEDQLVGIDSNAANEHRANNVRTLRLLGRKKTAIHAFASINNNVYPIEIRNISRGGAGIWLAHAVEINAPLNIHLISGRTIACHAVWSRLGFCGLMFETPLADSDELHAVPETSRQAAAATPPHTQPAQLSQHRPTQAISHQPGVPRQNAIQRAVERLVTAYRAAAAKRRFRQERAMSEIACRKQGYAWLVEHDFSPD